MEEISLEALQAEARREEVEALSTMRGLDLADPAVMSKAWRSLEDALNPAPTSPRSSH